MMHMETSLVQKGMGSKMPALRHTHQGLKTPRRAVTFAEGKYKLTVVSGDAFAAYLSI